MHAVVCSCGCKGVTGDGRTQRCTTTCLVLTTRQRRRTSWSSRFTSTSRAGSAVGAVWVAAGSATADARLWANAEARRCCAVVASGSGATVASILGRVSAPTAAPVSAESCPTLYPRNSAQNARRCALPDWRLEDSRRMEQPVWGDAAAADARRCANAEARRCCARLRVWDGV